MIIGIVVGIVVLLLLIMLGFSVKIIPSTRGSCYSGLRSGGGNQGPRTRPHQPRD